MNTIKPKKTKNKFKEKLEKMLCSTCNRNFYVLKEYRNYVGACPYCGKKKKYKQEE